MTHTITALIAAMRNALPYLLDVVGAVRETHQVGHADNAPIGHDCGELGCWCYRCNNRVDSLVDPAHRALIALDEHLRGGASLTQPEHGEQPTYGIAVDVARAIEAEAQAAEQETAAKNPMRSYSVAVTMTPRQAIEAMEGLAHAARTTESGRLFAASMRIQNGLLDAGWSWDAEKRAWTLLGAP
jgi:hypothetical protein